MLLSRLANYLFWFGRYLERAEHTARFVHTQHYAAMESQTDSHKKIFHNSMANMFGISNRLEAMDDPMYLQEKLLLNPENANSVLSNIEHARTNAMNVRNILSVEIYESVNRFYIFLQHPDNTIRKQGLDFELIQRITEYCALARNLINSTLLHDDAWAIIRFGIYLERAVQINRILASQVSTIDKLEAGDQQDAVRFMLLVTLLRSLQAKNTFYKVKRESISVKSVSEFLVTYQLFPRSILYNLEKSRHIYNRLFPGYERDAGGYELNHISDMFRYVKPHQFEDGLIDFLEDTQRKIEEIAYYVERDHLQI